MFSSTNAKSVSSVFNSQQLGACIPKFDSSASSTHASRVIGTIMLPQPGVRMPHTEWTITGHYKMRSGADLWGGTPLVSFNHVIDPHFASFSSSLYTTIGKHNPNPNRNCNPTVITDLQIGPRDNCHRSDPSRRSAPLRILSCATNDRCGPADRRSHVYKQTHVNAATMGQIPATPTPR